MKWQQKLSRVTSSGRFIPEVDGIRFMAISMVVLGHIGVYLVEKSGQSFQTHPIILFGMQSLTNAGLGVNLFFVLSGFILALPFAESYFAQSAKPSLKKYYLRRLTRLEPPYIIALTIAFLLLVFAQHSFSVKELLPHFIASLFYSHFFFWPDITPVVLPVAWSLEAEIQFYILAPFLAYVFILNKISRRILLLAMIILVPFIVEYWKLQQTFSLINHIQFFLAGFILADLYLTNKQEASSLIHQVAGWVSLCLLLWITPHYLDLSFHNQWLTPLLIIPVYYFILQKGFAASFFRNQWITIIGGMCYTLYLFHYMIISGVGRITVHFARGNDLFLNWLLQCLLILPLIFLCCVPFFYFVERVCMKRDWYKKIFTKDRKDLLQ